MFEGNIFRELLPFGPVKLWFYSNLIKYAVKKELRSQGTGRHLPHQILAMGRKDMEALSAVLGQW